MLISQGKFTSTNYVSSNKSNKAWYQLNHSLAATALPLHADLATVDQAEKPQMPIRHEWLIVSGRGGLGWWHKGVCYNVPRHCGFLSLPDIASDTSELRDGKGLQQTHMNAHFTNKSMHVKNVTNLFGKWKRRLLCPLVTNKGWSIFMKLKKLAAMWKRE